MTPRVLVTRSLDDAEPLTSLLLCSGLEVVHVPLIERHFLDEGIAELGSCTGFDWMVLTSRSAVDAWSRAGRPEAASQVAAVGHATADRAREAGLGIDVIPERMTGRALAASLPRLRGKSVLYPRARHVHPGTLDALRASGAVVCDIRVYENIEPVGLASDLDAARPVDAAILTSSSSAMRFARHGMAAEVPIVAIGPSTERAAREAGLDVAAVAREPSSEALVQAVCDLLGA